MSNRKPETTAQLIIDAVIRSKQRAISQSGWGGLHAKDLPDSIFLIESIPRTWLFPQIDSVIHHGGVGTTASGLQVRIPNIIVPFFGDQLYWGLRAAKPGVRPQHIPRKKLTAQKLASAIECSVSNSNMRSNAKALGNRIREENGVDVAVEMIKKTFQAY